ncbi:DUF427 domain-containing protein [Nucisporomicrobium flavum]|uniref:DUF427 domain-containing protein n=1 Tax=Nucisporomicrobium flavum TaxID=2785915 RepID=UPI003C2CBB48
MVWTPPQPSVEPSPRRVRVRLGGTVVADTQRAQLLIRYGPQGFPTYFVPLEDVRPGVLVDETPDGWSVEAGGRRAEAAATVEDGFAELKGHVTFSWDTLDWYEEDEPVHVHARDPHHRVDTVRASRRVEVFVDGERLAHSVRPVLLYETSLPTRYYLPFADVRTDLLTASETVTACPYKGQARYWSHARVPDVAWSYPDPVPELPKVRDLICFYNERVDLVVDGVRQERPESPF